MNATSPTLTNILLKSFDGESGKELIEEVFKDQRLGTCVSIMNDTTQMPDLNAEEHMWIPAAPLRQGEYVDIEWHHISPLDAKLIHDLRDTEAVFLEMMNRYETGEPISYGERKTKYLRHLRFWNDFLDTHKIHFALFNHVPHQCYDYVLYALCKYKQIPVRTLERGVVIDACFVLDDWRTSGTEVVKRYEELQKEGKPVQLSEEFQKYFDSFTQTHNAPWFMKNPKPPMQKSFIKRWSNVIVKGLIHKPLPILKALISPRIWHRKLQQHHTHLLYENNTIVPDLTQKYVYVPLHMQPEATTSPMAGVFTHQELIIQILASCLPPDVLIYVKEHPFQSERNRSEAFYKAMMEIPSVRFIPKTYDSFSLIENSIAVATATGTAGLEALFKKKPVLMFGSRFFQFAPGAFRIHSQADCQKAIDVILGGKVPDLQDLYIFLKAVEECSSRYVGFAKSTLTRVEQVSQMGRYISQRITPYLSV